MFSILTPAAAAMVDLPLQTTCGAGHCPKSGLSVLSPDSPGAEACLSNCCAIKTSLRGRDLTWRRLSLAELLQVYPHILARFHVY